MIYYKMLKLVLKSISLAKNALLAVCPVGGYFRCTIFKYMFILET